ncbi:MAG TPA: MlaD family protein [Cyclobacteriaceae bacterium]
MKSDDKQQNVKLGIFVSIGIVVFLLGVFFVGSQHSLFNRTFTVYAVFKNVEGLNQGDNVWLSGVKIGTVKEVSIWEDGKVIVKMLLKDKQNQFIKKNATATIGSDGFVGNKIVVIRPGNVTKTLDDNDTINASSPTDTQELLNLAKDVGENTRSITDDLKILIANLNKGQGAIGELLSDSGGISNDIRFAVGRLKATTIQSAQASEQLNSMMYKMNNGNGLINKLSTDTTFVAVFDSTLMNVKSVSRNAAAMSKNLEEVVKKLNNKNSTVGLVLTDTVFANKIKVTVDNAKSASIKLDENLEAMRHNFLFKKYFKKKDKEKAAKVGSE